jgi:hypothetical protein
MELHRAEKSIAKVLARLQREDQVKVLNAVLALHGLAVLEKEMT